MSKYDQLTYQSFIKQVSKLIGNSVKLQSNLKQIPQYPIDLMLDLIYDQQIDIQRRRMSCMLLKQRLLNKQQCVQQGIDHNLILGKLQTLYMINSQNNPELYRLQNAIELILQKIFQIHFDDNQKKQLYLKICQQLSKQPLIKQNKHLGFLLMIVRSMYYLSINSEELVGEVVLYLGELVKYVQGIKPMSSASLMISKENATLNQPNQSQQHENQMTNCNHNLNSNSLVSASTEKWVYQNLIKSIQLMKEIKEIVDINNEEQQNQVTQFMVTSKQLRNHLFYILKLQPLTLNQQEKDSSQNKNHKISVIQTSNSRLNKSKSQALTLWYQVWEYFAEPDLLQLIFSSVLTISKKQIVDQVETIIAHCVMILQRSCNHKEYAHIFFKMTQNLTLKLFQFVSINESQFSLMQTDPDYFIQINDDFCKQQELETLKTRAGSLIANLTLAIDGYLTFVTQLALLAVRQLQTQQQKPEAEVKIWNGFISIWGCSQEQLIQTSVLILSSISDQISKRKDLLLAMHVHLTKMIPYFNNQSALSKKPLLVLRYMQMYSFFSFPTCMDHFIRSYTNEMIYQKQISKSFEIIMRYYERKNPEMEKYIKQIGNSVMLLGDQLTPLLEQEIMNSNHFIKNFKEKVLEKLIYWFLFSYEKEQVLKINKLSTLIIRILHDNLRSQLHEDITLTPFNLQWLQAFVNQIYKLLHLKEQHSCEQAIIQVAISHVQYIYDLQRMDMKTANKFISIGKLVAERNKLSLNNCLQLFNSLICPDVPVYTKKNFMNFKFDRLVFQITLQVLNQICKWLEILSEGSHKSLSTQQLTEDDSLFRQEDLWEILQLSEICLFQIQVFHHSIQCKTQDEVLQYKSYADKILNFGLKTADKFQSTTLKTKVISLILQIVQLFPENTESYGFLSHFKFPNSCQFPAYQCKKYAYCLFKIMKNYQNHFQSNVRVHILKVVIDLIYFLQNEKLHMKNYQQLIQINGDSVSLNAAQKRNKIYSPFDFRIPFQCHEQFRQLIRTYPVKEQLSFLNQQQQYKGKIRDLLDKIIVNEKPRKKITVKRNF